MRRVILAVTGTIAGLVALLSFKSHVPSVPVAATTGGSGGSSSSSAPSSSSSSSSSSGGQTTTVPGEFPQGSLASKLTAGETAVDGKAANTLHDSQIGAFAFPHLISETLAAQSGKIDAVSGASYTSAGYIQSLQSALDKRAL